MSEQTTAAQTLAGDICCSIVYPRLADFVMTAQRYCAWDSAPLGDEQVEQIMRALAETSDGMLSAIAGAIDARNARSLLEGLRDA